MQWDGPAVDLRPSDYFRRKQNAPGVSDLIFVLSGALQRREGDYSKCNNVSAAAGAVGAAAAYPRYPVPPWGCPGRNATRGTDPNGLL